MQSLITTHLLITGISMAQPPNPPSVPKTISFQAMITDTLGVPIADGSHNFTFRIERPNQGGQVQTIWEETKQVDVVDGIVSTILGSVTPIGFIPISDNYSLSVALENEVISISPLTSVPFSFNASRAMNATNATHADTAHFTHQADHAMYADTAHFVMNVPMSDTVHFSHQASHAHYADSSGFAHHTQHAEHADTAHFVMNVPMSDTSGFALESQHSEHADTANYVNLSNYNGSISVIKDDDANVTIQSDNNNSSSFLTLISQTSTGVQRELRVINEGDVGGGFRLYDATNGEDLMVIDTSGNVGIGTSSPDQTLHLHDSEENTRVMARFTNGTTGSASSDGLLIGVHPTSANTELWNFENTHMTFATNNQLRMRISNDGNVGINNSNPSEKLQVDGTIKANKYIYSDFPLVNI